MYSSSDDDSYHHRTTTPRKHRKRGGGSKKERRQAAAAAAAAQQEILRQLASLQLPHMEQHHQQPDDSDPPTIRILVVADIDLASASALAESALTSEELHRVDLCIACGPFCREEDLRPYYQGRQRRRHMARYNNTYHHAAMSSYAGGGNKRDRMSMIPPMPQHNYAATSSMHNSSAAAAAASNYYNSPYPFRRTREETAALEGLMTAALSQLESIVCRVIFVPGRTDPMTTISTSNQSCTYTKERRLTPNSRNIHQHWMPLSPGLGCAGLLHLDWQQLQHPPPLEDGEMDDEDDDDDDDDSDSELPEDSSFSYNNGDDPYSSLANPHHPPQHNSGSFAAVEGSPENNNNEEDDMHEPLTEAERAEQYGTEFVNHLEHLVRLAPPTSAVSETPVPHHASIAGLLKTTLFQSILVTHFHHLEKDYTEYDVHGSDSNLLLSPSTSGSLPYHHSGYSNNTYNNMGGGGQQQQYYSTGSKNTYAPYSPGMPTTTSTNTITPTNNHRYSTEMDGYHPNSAANLTADQQQQQQIIDNSNEAAAAPDDEDDDDDEEESFDPPWPMEHESFCALPVVQEHVLLEIAAGRNSMGSTVMPMELPKGENMRVILPGSLRERGEFCLIDVAFMKDNKNKMATTTSTTTASTPTADASDNGHNLNKSNADYRWRVRRTRFHTINDYGNVI